MIFFQGNIIDVINTNFLRHYFCHFIILSMFQLLPFIWCQLFHKVLKKWMNITIYICLGI